MKNGTTNTHQKDVTKTDDIHPAVKKLLLEQYLRSPNLSKQQISLKQQIICQVMGKIRNVKRNNPKNTPAKGV